MPAMLELRERRFVDIGGPVHYREWEGPAELTFVLVHGLGGSHLNWIQVAGELSGRGRVLVPDLAGFGLTPRAGRGSSLPANRSLLAAFIRATATGRVVVAGNSMGGGLALLQAALEPESVDGLVLSGATFPWARGGMPSPAVIGGFALYRTPMIGDWLIRQRFTRMPPELLVRLGFKICCADPAAIPEELVQAHVELLREHQRDPDAGPAFLEAARSIMKVGARREACRTLMNRISCPVLVIHGHRDRLIPAAFARAATHERHSWRLRVLPDVGHIPQMEAPDRWLAAVEDWLDASALA